MNNRIKDQALRVQNHPVLGDMSKSRTVTISVNGHEVEALEGESLAAALWASGTMILESGKRGKRKKTPFCFIGICGECRVEVDGKNVMSCNTRVVGGMRVITSGNYI